MEDSHTILRALAIKRFVHKCNGRDLLTCVQLIRPENKQLFVSSMKRFQAQIAVHRQTAPASPPATKLSLYTSRVMPTARRQVEIAASTNVAISVEQVKLALLAKSCLVPGLPNLLFHLTASSSSNVSKASSARWLREHEDGKQFEVYRVPLSTKFHHMLFHEVVSLVYHEVGIVLFALELWSRDGKSERVVLNPCDLPIPDINKYNVHGYVIAADKREADQVSSMGRSMRSRRLMKAMVSTRRVSQVGQVVNAAVKAKRTFHHIIAKESSASSITRPKVGWDTYLPPELASFTDDPTPMRTPFVAKSASVNAASPPRAGAGSGGGGGTGKGGTEKGGNSSNKGRAAPSSVAALAAMAAASAVPSASAKARASSLTTVPLLKMPAQDHSRDGDDKAAADAPAPTGSMATAAGVLKDLRVAAQGRSVGLNAVQSLFLTKWAAKRKAAGSLIPDVASAPWPIANHVVVCGLSGVSTSALEHLLRPLRAAYLPAFPTVVIMMQQPPPRTMMKRISAFMDVWFVQGSPFTSADLHRAGVHKAVTSIIFKQNITKRDDMSLVDADTICIYRLMKACNPALEVVCELISKESIAFLSAESVDEYSTKVFASGHVFTPAFLDILLCQSYYAPHVRAVFCAVAVGRGTALIHVVYICLCVCSWQPSLTTFSLRTCGKRTKIGTRPCSRKSGPSGTPTCSSCPCFRSTLA